jgi:hypothetical protein
VDSEQRLTRIDHLTNLAMDDDTDRMIDWVTFFCPTGSQQNSRFTNDTGVDSFDVPLIWRAYGFNQLGTR